MGGRSSSSSAATTNNQDNRVAVQDGIGLSASNNNTISITDGGIVSRGLDTVDLGIAATTEALQTTTAKAFDAVNLTSANNADSFTRLLETAEGLFSTGENLLTKTQQSLVQAYSQAEADKGGTIDNRTVIVLAVAGAATLALIATRGRRA